ncbi:MULTISPECIES: FAD:protein FMN transferase [Plantibacter]|uniref:FAD:protein FMN transferase n=1 Tax=Plantibacter TaxID=190323 RepID=UPI00254C6170|nr:FAD:protein FMN transferase [Plantibacter sp. lyk4-40-MEA-4]
MSETTLRFEAIGTGWELDTALPLEPETAEAVAACIDRFDRTWSRFRDDAFIARFAAGPVSTAFPDDAREDAVALLDTYRRLHDATAGAVTPFIGTSLERLGYDAAYSLVPQGPAVAAPHWDDVARWDGEVLETSVPLVIDIGAAGKGRLVDLVADLLRSHGHESFTVDASGDLRHEHGSRTSDPLRIALEHPYDPSKAIGVATIDDGALCASATNRRAWGDGLHHVIDGRTGEPTRTVAATWVTAREAMVADGLATALFFTDHETLAEAFTFESVRMFTSGLTDRSVGFPGELFT